MVEEDRHMETRLDVAQHEERDEGQTTQDGYGQKHTILLWLNT